MKKVIIFLFVLTIMFIGSNREEQIIIPKESIRFRIIANSNSVQDQLFKMELRTNLLPILNNLSAENIEKTRKNIQSNINVIEDEIGKYTNNFNVNFGQNYFPEKIYQDVVYNAGNYESLVITLGNGVGDNWWCVLFPPLCLLEAEENNIDDVTYKSYVKTIINKHF